MDVKFELIGADSINAKLKAVVDDVKFKSGRAALRKAANIIRDAAIANAQRVDAADTPEDIAKNIMVRWNGRRFKANGDLGFRVGVRGGGKASAIDGTKANPGGDTWYWRLVEFGTSRTRARPFMRPALSQNIGAAQAEFIKQYGKGLDRAIKRAAKGKQ